MSKLTLFLHLVAADIRRLKKHIPSVVISVLLLLGLCSAAALLISRHIYKEGDFTTVKLAYYIPADKDEKYTSMATNMLSEMQSMQETARLCRVASIDEGYNMLEKGEALYFIIVPEDFFSGIMNGTNPRLKIVIKDNSTITSYIANELFLSYAAYLGIAQSANYSMLDTYRLHNYSTNEQDTLQNTIDITFLERTLNKSSYTKTIEATDEGSFSLTQYYLAGGVMISLLLMAIVLMPFLIGRGDGVLAALKVHGINCFHIFASNIMCCIIAIYIAFMPCDLLLSATTADKFVPKGLITVMPAVMVISIVISLAALLGARSLFAANMLILGFTMLLAYVGGCLLPHAMLPSIIQKLSAYLPGRYVVNCIAAAIFGS